MSIIRFGRFLPVSLREWDRILAPLNRVISQTSSGSTTISADTVIASNLPASEASYITVAPNDSLPNERRLGVVASDLTITDAGANETVALGLVDVGTAGTYTKVTTDDKGRVASGTTLASTDMPAEVPLRNVNETISQPWEFDQGVVLGKTQYTGIKVDTDSPTYGYRDIIGTPQEPSTAVGRPSFSQIASSGVYTWSYATNDLQFYSWHVPHDIYGTTVYFHAHWFGSQTAGASTKWNFSYLYSKGHAQAAFPTSATTVSVEQQQSTTAYTHMIAETVGIVISGLEPDGLILCKVQRVAPSGTDVTGSVFVPVVDLHYASTNMATKQKAPPFWT